MRKPLIIFGLALGAAVIVAGAVFLDWGEREKARLWQAMQSDLIVGATQQDVERWLDRHGAKPIISRDNDGRLVAIKATLYREYFLDWNGYLDFVFGFDDNGRLAKRSVCWSPNAL
jgi:hypothetical protein